VTEGILWEYLEAPKKSNIENLRQEILLSVTYLETSLEYSVSPISVKKLILMSAHSQLSRGFLTIL